MQSHEMRNALLATLAVVGLIWIGWGNSGAVAQSTQPISPSVKPLMLTEGMIALSSDTADGRQQIAVIDSKTRVMSVYHVEHKSGVISLKSVRSLSADLMMDEFNTDNPLPREIRVMLKR
jgi:hypothetical protein